jgi:hypothetical protein
LRAAPVAASLSGLPIARHGAVWVVSLSFRWSSPDGIARG